MTRTMLAMILVLAFGSAIAARTIEPIEGGGYELTLSNVVLPTSTAGSVIFRVCDACDQITLRVSSETGYLINDQQLALADFLVAVEEIRLTSDANESTAVTIFYDLEATRATRIMLHADSNLLQDSSNQSGADSDTRPRTDQRVPRLQRAQP